jgi:hypothetical protein
VSFGPILTSKAVEGSFLPPSCDFCNQICLKTDTLSLEKILFSLGIGSVCPSGRGIAHVHSSPTLFACCLCCVFRVLFHQYRSLQAVGRCEITSRHLEHGAETCHVKEETQQERRTSPCIGYLGHPFKKRLFEKERTFLLCLSTKEGERKIGSRLSLLMLSR